MFACRPRGGDAQVGLVFGQVQNFRAVDEHGVARLAGKETPFFDLADVGDQLPLDAPRLAQQGG